MKMPKSEEEPRDKLRARAKKVGVKPLKGKRPTPGQRKSWKNKIIQAEKLL